MLLMFSGMPIGVGVCLFRRGVGWKMIPNSLYKSWWGGGCKPPFPLQKQIHKIQNIYCTEHTPVLHYVTEAFIWKLSQLKGVEKMREIKFRGKRVDNGVWVYGYLIGNNVIVDELDSTGAVQVNPETVGQYTGLKDENGTDIYEGDVWESFVVRYNKFYAGFKPFVHDGGCGCCADSGTGHTAENGIIIGNIHENQELLGR